MEEIKEKAIRIFYKKATGGIVWTHSLVGRGEFSSTVKEDLDSLSSFIGGVSSSYACIEETDRIRILGIRASDSNKVVDGKVVIGNPR